VGFVTDTLNQLKSGTMPVTDTQ